MVTISKDKQFLIFEEEDKKSSLDCNTLEFYGLSGRKVKNLPLLIKKIMRFGHYNAIVSDSKVKFLIDYLRNKNMETPNGLAFVKKSLGLVEKAINLDLSVNIYEYEDIPNDFFSISLDKKFCDYLKSKRHQALSYSAYLDYKNLELFREVLPNNIIDLIFPLARETSGKFALYVGKMIQYKHINQITYWQSLARELYKDLKNMNKEFKEEKDFFGYCIKSKMENEIYKNEQAEKLLQEHQKDYLAYEDEKFQVVIPKTKKEFKKESEEQSNCVYNAYLPQVISGEINIVFVREKGNLEKSLITCAVKGRRITDYLLRFNIATLTEEQRNFRNKYQEYLKTLEI